MRVRACVRVCVRARASLCVCKRRGGVVLYWFIFIGHSGIVSIQEYITLILSHRILQIMLGQGAMPGSSMVPGSAPR